MRISIHIIFFTTVLVVTANSSMANESKTEKKFSLDEAHLYFAKSANNETWNLLEKDQLSRADKEQLRNSAFASLYHWKKIGTVANKQRGEWLLSRVFVKLKDPEAALIHAKKCMKLTETHLNELKDFDIAYAYEAMARSMATLGDLEKAGEYYQHALEHGKVIIESEDRNLFLSDLKGGVWGDFKPSE